MDPTVPAPRGHRFFHAMPPRPFLAPAVPMNAIAQPVAAPVHARCA